MVILLGLLGICLGSFVNALVWRLHEQEELKQKKPKNIRKQLQQLSITKGRSMCPSCKHQLHAQDLVPVLSWLSLGGKCRYCRRPISTQYPVVELITGVLFVLSYITWPFVLDDALSMAAFAVWLLIVVGFVAHSVYDIKWYTLLDRITVPLTFFGVIYVILQAYVNQSIQGIIGGLLGAITLFGLFYFLFHISDGMWVGGGDVKLMPLLGLLAGGLYQGVLLLFVASSAGTIFALLAAVVLRKPLRMSTRVPFGPFLIGATIFVVLFGASITTWYTDLFVL